MSGCLIEVGSKSVYYAINNGTVSVEDAANRPAGANWFIVTGMNVDGGGVSVTAHLSYNSGAGAVTILVVRCSTVENGWFACVGMPILLSGTKTLDFIVGAGLMGTLVGYWR